MIVAAAQQDSPAAGLRPHEAGWAWGATAWRRAAWAKTAVLPRAMRAGLHVVWSDVDVVWFRDPTPLLSQHPEVGGASLLRTQGLTVQMATAVAEVSTRRRGPVQQWRDQCLPGQCVLLQYLVPLWLELKMKRTSENPTPWNLKATASCWLPANYPMRVGRPT